MSNGTIYETIEKIILSKIVVNIISIICKIQICEEIAKKTEGSCEVAKNSTMFDQLVLNYANPYLRKESKLLNTQFMVSFPKMSYSDMPVLCACHKTFKKIGYECSFCMSWNCEMPSICAVCKIP